MRFTTEGTTKVVTLKELRSDMLILIDGTVIAHLTNMDDGRFFVYAGDLQDMGIGTTVLSYQQNRR